MLYPGSGATCKAKSPAQRAQNVHFAPSEQGLAGITLVAVREGQRARATPAESPSGSTLEADFRRILLVFPPAQRARATPAESSRATVRRELQPEQHSGGRFLEDFACISTGARNPLIIGCRFAAGGGLRASRS